MTNLLIPSLIVAAVITLIVYALIFRTRRKSPAEYRRNLSGAWKTSSKPIDERRFTVIQLTQEELDKLEQDLRDMSEEKP